jgi:Uma2 family endonuclease
MSQLVKEPNLTAEQCRRLEHEAGLEYVDGQFEEKSVSRESSRVAENVSFQLKLAQGQPPTVEVYGQDLAYRCHPERPNWVRKPDVSLIRKERLSDLGDVGMMPIPPDLAVEVVSPHELARDVNQKIEEYLAAGFPLVWVVSPEMRMVDVYHADGRISRLRANDPIAAEGALPEFRCQVSSFFE